MEDDLYDVTPEEVLTTFPPGEVRDFWLKWAIQRSCGRSTAWTTEFDAPHHRSVRVLAHIKKLDDALGQSQVQITCKCGAHRIAEPETLAQLCGRSATLEAVGKRMRCSKCGTKGAEVVAVSIPRLRERDS